MKHVIPLRGHHNAGQNWNVFNIIFASYMKIAKNVGYHSFDFR